MRISVIGTGYLGATHAACLAELGHEVWGLDVDPLKIESLAAGEVPFYEPGLAELIRRHLDSGRLRFTTSYEEVGAWADVHFVGVGTPERAADGSADTQYVEAAITSLAWSITRDALIVGKSTVPVGTARRLRDLLAREQNQELSVGLAWNPEFLREGLAVKDTLSPDRIVLGVEDERHAEILRGIYADAIGQGTPVLETDFETAELIKVAANAFLATKVSFINAFSELTEAVGGDIKVLSEALGHDPRIGRSYLRAGLGFGGGCLPKDLRALQARASELGHGQSLRFLSEVEEVNLRRRERAVALASAMLGDLRSKKIAALGAAFKPHSDDVRDSPALEVAARLFDAGAEVTVYDPKATGSAALKYPRLQYEDSLEGAVAGAELVVLLTEWPEFVGLTPAVLGQMTSARKIVDARNVLSPDEWIADGWDFAALGRKHASSLAYTPIGA